MAEQPISIHYQQMEEWLEDRKSVFAHKYKRPYTELLSLAPRLVQLGQYDIPAMEKQMRRNETAIEECHRVGAEAEHTQQKLREKRTAMLDEYGITEDGADISAAVDVRIASACTELNAACQAYSAAQLASFKAYYNALLESTASGHFSSDAFTLHFPWLQRLLAESNLALRSADEGAVAEMDVGKDDGAGPQIDWGDDAAAVVLGPAAAVEINWDVEEMDVVVTPESDSVPPADGVHSSIDLAQSKHRANVLAELQALSCFCKERGGAEMERARAGAEELRELLLNSKEAEFARMRENYRAKDAFLDRVDRFEQQVMVARTRHAAHEAKMRDAEAEQAQLRPQYTELLAKTMAIRDAAIACLTQMFPDRRILIVGDLNKYSS